MAARDELRGLYPFWTALSARGQTELGALPIARAPARRLLLQRGDPAGGAYLVLRGDLRVFYVTADGREATLYHVEPGGTCVLALSATLGDEPYPAWVEVAAPVGLVRVPPTLLHGLVDRERGFRAFVLAALAGRTFELMCALEETATVHVEARVARYLVRRAGPTGVVAPFYYCFTLWAVLSGLFVFGYLPNVLALAGIVLVVASGLAIVFLDERRRRLAPVT